MTPGETDPTLRRLFFELFLDDGVTPATDADVAAPADTIQVSSNGTALADSAGTFTRITSNLYYYQFTTTEALNGSNGFVGLKFERAGYHTDLFIEIVGDIFSLAETDPARLRFPTIIFGTAVEPQVPTEGATVTAPSDLQVSYNGGSFVDSAGSLVEIGSGLYYYQGVAADADTRRRLLVKYESTGFSPAVLSIDVDVPGSTTVVTPTGPAPIPVLPATDSAFVPIDHVTGTLSRLPHQYRGNGETLSRTQTALRILVEPFNVFDQTAVAVLTGLDVEHAIGAQLDIVGKKVGRPREGITDDEIYRRYCRAQISANKSDGVIKDILTVARLVLGTVDGYTLTLKNDGVAAYRLEVGGAALPTDIAAVLIKLAKKATAAGVRMIVEYSTQPPENVLRWTTQETWGNGVWARATDREI